MSLVTVDLPAADLAEAERRAAADGIALETWLALAIRVGAYVADHGRYAPTASPWGPSGGVSGTVSRRV